MNEPTAELRKKFSDDESHRFAAGVLGRSRSARQHALAAKQLSDRFSAADLKTLSPAERASRSALVVFSHREKGRNREMCRALYENGIDIAVREGNLRASPHLFNASDDIERLLRGLGGGT